MKRFQGSNIVIVLLAAVMVLTSVPLVAEGDGVRAPEEIIVAYKTHFDIGYTALAHNIVRRYRTEMIDQVFELSAQTAALPPEQQFVWTLPGWPMRQLLAPGQTAERAAKVERSIRDGRLVWHALPFTVHTSLLEPESLVRGLMFSSSLARQFDMPLPRDSKMTDVPSHSWILPTMLKHAGVDFLHIGSNGASSSPKVPLLFWWEGPDGSRLLTMYFPYGYGSDNQNKVNTSKEPFPWGYGNGLIPPKGWPFKTWLLFRHSGDNHGPPSPKEVEELMAEVQEKWPGARVRLGRLSDFADAILAESPDLPVIRADMPDSWIHGTMTMPQETRMMRTTQPAIGELQSLNTLLGIWDSRGLDLREFLPEVYEGVLLYGEHTWGVGGFPRSFDQRWFENRARGVYDRAEASWDAHGDYIRRAKGTVDAALKRQREVLAQAAGVEGERWVVFNQLPWRRDAVVSPALGSEAAFVARDLPPMGYRTFTAAELTSKAADLKADEVRSVLENEFLRVRLDPESGTIASIVEKATGRELVKQDAEYGFGQYLYERFDADDAQGYVQTYSKKPIPKYMRIHGKPGIPPASERPSERGSPGEFELEIERSGSSIGVTMRSRPTELITHRIGTRVVLHTGQPYVDVEWEVYDKQATPWPEAGWICFPINVDAPTFRLGRPGAVADPSRDFIANSNFDLIALHTGMTVAGRDGKGVGLCPIDLPLVSIGTPGIYKFTGRWEPRKPVIFTQLFNSAWGTNFKEWTEGAWRSRVRVWATSGQGDWQDLLKPSWGARAEATAAKGTGPAGPLPATRPGLQLSRSGVLVTAFGPNPDGEGLLLRLWEQAGEDGECRVRLPEGLDVESIQPCDLRGRAKGAPVPVSGNAFEVRLRRYAPASFLMR